MAQIQCIFLEPTPFAEVSLRRYSSESCRGRLGYHDASVKIGTCPYPLSDFDGEFADNLTHDDSRWPAACATCGYAFQETDCWQHMKQRLYGRGDHLTMTTTLSEAPIGSMWFADWYDWKGPDGHCLIVKTPGGDWIVDAPSWSEGAQTGRPWSRTGDVPNVTANPSIHFPGKYHGWLRNGVLTDV